jgi:hypothetical protein
MLQIFLKVLPPTHIVRKMVNNREFNIYASSKMHFSPDFLATEEGMYQVKNHEVVIEVYTNRNQISYDYEQLRNPTFKILQHENLEKISSEQIDEMLKEFYEKKLIWEKHKTIMNKFPRPKTDLLLI